MQRPAELEKAIDEFVDETEGLLLLDLSAIAQLARSETVSFDRIADAVRRYKVGVRGPLAEDRPRQNKFGGRFRAAAVKGQAHAVTHMLDIVKRAVTGVGSPRGGRPRGVAFLAGPTGVGKTELAKTMTSLLFGDESAYIRFDMSEFSAEHSDQRLIGAPPGYVGYDVGGELTNAIREKPFSVVLFDEIEKAHPRILDKFLQILDDGVLTSGRGDRVYFSEALIVFTSNLGIYTSAAGERIPNVTPEETFETVKQGSSRNRNISSLVLNRPEILNRIGENIIVFDFIRPESRTRSSSDGRAAAHRRQIAGLRGVAFRRPRGHTPRLCLADLSNGGRGIRNQVEAHLINPLSRALFDSGAETGRSYRSQEIHTGASTTVTLRTGRRMTASIALSRIHFPVTTLGPGRRIGIWFQGCSIRCPGCISMDTWAPGRGITTIDEVVSAIAQWIPTADGITISGGEPFDQPVALIELLERCVRSPKQTCSYSPGHPWTKSGKRWMRPPG